MKRILIITGILMVIFDVEAQNVGIGTEDPQSTLHVAGSIRTDSLYVMQRLGIGTSASGRPLTIKGDNGNVMGIQNNAGIEKWMWWLDDNDNLALSPGNPNNMFVANSNGNIGMGNYYPEAKLHIAKYSINTGANDLLLIENYGEGGAGIKFKRNQEANAWQCYADLDSMFKIGRQDIANYLSIKTNGNVGLGTETPYYRLDAQVNSSNATIARFQSNGGFANILVGNSTRTATLGSDNQSAYVGTSTADHLRFTLGGITRAIMRYESGHFGLGTSQPAYRLDAQSDGSNATVARFRTTGGFSDVYIESGIKQMILGLNDLNGYVQSTDALLFKIAGHDRIAFTASGHLGVGTMSPSYRLDAQINGPDATVAHFKTTGGFADVLIENGTKQMKLGVSSVNGYVQSTDALLFNIGGYDRMGLTYAGHLGIGTTTPSYRLDAQINAPDATVARFKTTGGFSDIYIENGTKQMQLGVNSVNGYVQSTDALLFNIGGYDRMGLTYAGHLGIGTTTPSYRLDAQINAPDATVARFKTTGGFSDIYIENGTKQMQLGVNSVNGYVQSTDALLFNIGGYDRMGLTYAGHLGIGTTTPEYRLDARNNSMNTTIAQFKNTGGYANILINNSSKFATLGVDDIGAYIGTISQDDIRFTTAGTTHMTVQHGSGNVGIGAESPSSKLHLLRSGDNVGTNDILLIENTGTGGAGIRFKNQAVPSALWQCYIENDGKFKIGRDVLADYMTIELDGNVQFAGTILNEAVETPDLLNNWVNYDAGFETAGFFIDKFGMVHLKGLVHSGTSAHIMTLPEDYRPAGQLLFTVVSGNGFARIDVKSNGDVTLIGTYSTDYVSLSGIAFRI